MKSLLSYHVNELIWHLTLNSIRGPKRPESNFAYTQHWYCMEVTLQALFTLQYHLFEWYKPIKFIKHKSDVELCGR